MEEEDLWVEINYIVNGVLEKRKMINVTHDEYEYLITETEKRFYESELLYDSNFIDIGFYHIDIQIASFVFKEREENLITNLLIEYGRNNNN